jgi:hypothetical protein
MALQEEFTAGDVAWVRTELNTMKDGNAGNTGTGAMFTYGVNPRNETRRKGTVLLLRRTDGQVLGKALLHLMDPRVIQLGRPGRRRP